MIILLNDITMQNIRHMYRSHIPLVIHKLGLFRPNFINYCFGYFVVYKFFTSIGLKRNDFNENTRLHSTHQTLASPFIYTVYICVDAAVSMVKSLQLLSTSITAVINFQFSVKIMENSNLYSLFDSIKRIVLT